MMKKLRIFAASPSDTAAERVKVETVASQFKPLADNLGIVLEVVDWRAVVPDMGRPEQVILDQLKPTSWDVFIGILWHRFGTPPAGQDEETQKEYLSGTEEEFKTAYRLWKQYGKPRIMMYRCKRNPPLDELDPDQFRRVKDFFAQFEAVEGEHPGLYQTFTTTKSFENLLQDNLQRLLLEYGKQLKGAPIEPEVVQQLAPKIPDNLPRRAPFFGRDKEMNTVMRALSPEDRTWGVLLDGIGGIGKSALAVEAAYRCKEQGLFDAFIFVSAKQNILDPQGIRGLTPAAQTLDEFLNETARTLGQSGIAKLESEEKRRDLIEALRGTRALLVYDNLETLKKEDQEALADFLRELPPACKAITTSRRRGGEGAVWLRLEKLEWDAARSIIESEIERDRQLANKLRRAGEAHWQELYDETKGSPLALMHTLGLMRVRAALTFDGALELLRGNRDSDLQNFIFQEARKELTENDQTALRALSFFVPSGTFEAWAEVAELTRNALETTIDRLSALSLVDVLTGEDRYALHPITRNFVRGELLADAQMEREAGRRFANYWLSYAQRYGGNSKESYKTFDRIEVEWSNLDAAAEWLWQRAAVQDRKIDDKDAAQGMGDLAKALCGASGPLFFMGRWTESLQLSARAYQAMHALGEWSEAGRNAYQGAWIYYYRANMEEAERWTELCNAAWEFGGSKYEQATGMCLRGLLARLTEDYDAAEQLYQSALWVFRDLHYDLNVANTLNDLGGLEHNRKQYEAAERYYQEASVLSERQGFKGLLTVVTGNWGLLSLDRKYWAEALKRLEKALSLAHEIGRQDLIARNLYRFALVHEAEGHFDLALPLAQEAMAIFERLRAKDEAETLGLVERLMKRTSGK